MFAITSDTAVDLHTPIPAPTETSESISVESSSISTMKIGGIDKRTNINVNNDSNDGNKSVFSLSPSRVMMNNSGCDKTDKESKSNDGMELTDKQPLANQSVEKLSGSPDDSVVAIKLCETCEANSTTGVCSDWNTIDDFHENEVDDGRIRLGICAMDKKARSKPMAEILSRIDENTYQVVFFGDTVLLHDPPTSWPKCDVLIAFYSKGYPLHKVKEYVKIFKPYVLNDLDMQEVIQDRRRVYDTLEGSGIDVPRHVYLSRDGYKSTGSGDGNGSNDQDVMEHDDSIVVNGITIQKPFVEKPVNAENHNISIYYPTTAGGGCKKLFRKIGNRSSDFYPDINEVRRDGSYIYEEFVETQGTDVKMYTVGPGMWK